MSSKTFCWSKKKAEKIFKKNLCFIKNTIERKIPIYYPLKVETSYPEFLQWLQREDFKAIREMPHGPGVKFFLLRRILAGFKVKAYLVQLVKNFLIERAYYALSEKYIRGRMMKKLDIPDPNDIRLLEITDFIMMEIESNGMARLKKFRERSNFKYFLGMVITNLWYDFLRAHYHTKKNLEKFAPGFRLLFERPVESPYDLIIQWEDEEFKKNAAEILPTILASLEPAEKMVIKWKYEDGLTISAISRALGKTRYKTGQLLQETVEKIKKRLNKISREVTPGVTPGDGKKKRRGSFALPVPPAAHEYKGG